MIKIRLFPHRGSLLLVACSALLIGCVSSPQEGSASPPDPPSPEAVPPAPQPPSNVTKRPTTQGSRSWVPDPDEIVPSVVPDPVEIVE